MVIIVCFLFWMVSESRAEEKEIGNFRMRELAVNDFAVKVSGFGLSTYEQELGAFAQVYDGIRDRDRTWDRNGGGLLANIVQIKVPEVD